MNNPGSKHNRVPRQFLGLLDKKKQSDNLDTKIALLITKGKLPLPIQKR